MVSSEINNELPLRGLSLDVINREFFKRERCYSIDVGSIRPIADDCALKMDESNQHSPALQAWLVLGALAIMVGLIYYTYTYPYPNGKPPDNLSFVLFWAREILILVAAALFILVMLVAWCVRLFKRMLFRSS